VLSTYAQRFSDEAARMGEEIGRKDTAELIEPELVDSERAAVGRLTACRFTSPCAAT